MKRATLSLLVLLAGVALLLALIPAQMGIARPTTFDAMQLSCPDCTTATPVLDVDNQGGTNDILVLRDNGTPVFSVADTGAVTGFGSNGLSVSPNLVVAAPTAVGTATPVALFNTAGGLSNLMEIRANSTPVLTIANDGAVSGITQDLNTENLGMLPSICTASITYTAAGGTGTVCSIGAGETWFIHAVYVEVTSNFNATGDDATLVVGDGNDPNGLIDLVDAELQTSDTEGTGAPAGWQGFMSGDTRGAYLAEGTGFVYVGAETIDYVIDEGSGETLSAGAATIYVVYTRVE